MQRSAALRDDYPLVCIVVESSDGKLLNEKLQWEEIPAQEAKRFFCRMDEIKEELRRHSIGDCYVCWTIVFEGSVEIYNRNRLNV